MNRRVRTALFALFMVLCGLVALVTIVMPLLDTHPLLYDASSTIEPSRESHAALEPRVDEWPLMLAKHAVSNPVRESYALEVVAGVRQTPLIRLTVSAASPENAQAAATWMGQSFASSLRQSYASRQLAPERLWDKPEGLPLASPESIASLAFQLFVPTLLIAGGIILFRVRNDKTPNA